MDPNIHSFLVELLHDAGQTDLGPELEEVMVQDLAPRLEDRLVLTCTQQLSAEQQEEVKEITDTDQVMMYLRNTIPNFEEITAQALVDFREVYIKAVKGE
jgi:hypothetical protein